MISVASSITQRHPWLPGVGFPKGPAATVLVALIHENEIKRFLDDNSGLDGFAFIDRVLDYFSFDYTYGNYDRRRVPDYGRAVIVANHPIGTLDGLALMKFISEIRRDVRIVANQVLSVFEPLSPLLIPVDNMTGKISKSSAKVISHALEQEQVVVFFPAGEVSRVNPKAFETVAGTTGSCVSPAGPALPS